MIRNLKKELENGSKNRFKNGFTELRSVGDMAVANTRVPTISRRSILLKTLY